MADFHVPPQKVCLARFRVDDLAVVLPQCLHA